MSDSKKNLCSGEKASVNKVSIAVDKEGDLVVVLHGKNLEQKKNFSLVLTSANTLDLSETLFSIRKELDTKTSTGDESQWN